MGITTPTKGNPFDDEETNALLANEPYPHYRSTPTVNRPSTATSGPCDLASPSSLKSLPGLLAASSTLPTPTKTGALVHCSLPHFRHHDNGHQQANGGVFHGPSSTAERFFNSLRECRSTRAFTGSYKPIPELESSERDQLRLSRRHLAIIFALIYGNFWVAACVSLQAPFFPKEAELKGDCASAFSNLYLTPLSPFQEPRLLSTVLSLASTS